MIHPFLCSSWYHQQNYFLGSKSFVKKKVPTNHLLQKKTQKINFIMKFELPIIRHHSFLLSFIDFET